VGALSEKNDELQQAEQRAAVMLEETRKANEELMKTDKAKDEFLSVVTHDLEMPLVSVLGYADVLHDGIVGEVNEKQKSALEVIKKHGKILQNMIESILDYTKLTFEKVRVESDLYSINSQIIEIAHDFRLQFDRKKIRLDMDLPSVDVMIRADRGMLRRVIANLLENAFRYTPEGGRVVVILQKERDFVRITVEDNGVGIAPKKLSRVFEKFYIVKDEEARLSRRLGLGLYIAKQFVEAHGGKVWAESEGEGKGSKFIFTLPVA
jgi:hypothetical protein